MNPTVANWVNAFHIYGFLMWTGTLIALLNVLSFHAEVDPAGRPAFEKLEKAAAMAMDIGATIAMAAGIYWLVASEFVYLKGAGYFHAKLFLVLLFLGLHGFVRAKVKRFRLGQVKPIPKVMPLAGNLIVLGIVILVVVKPF